MSNLNHTEYMRQYYYTPAYKIWRKKYLDKKKSDPKFKELNKIRYKRYLEKNQKKHKARQKLRNALRDERIEKSSCAVCNSINSEAHHYLGYEYPLIVRWYCKKHHMELHRKYA